MNIKTICFNNLNLKKKNRHYGGLLIFVIVTDIREFFLLAYFSNFIVKFSEYLKFLQTLKSFQELCIAATKFFTKATEVLTQC